MKKLVRKFVSRVHLTYGIYISLLCCTFIKGQTAPNVTGFGGETTMFTCPSPAITPGGSYILRKDSVSFYDDTSDGRIIDGKYNATAGNGEIKLLILNTNISDAGTYTCSHNFVDTSGYVSVAFRPENITTATTMLTNGWQLTATATKVFPSDSAISSVICLKSDKSSLPFGLVGQSVNPNSDIPYLFDISWNGTITEHLSGQVQCTITLVIIETIVRTIVVSFPETSTSTNSTPNSTSATVPPTLSTTTQIIQNTTDLTPDVCWCKITPWWWCIILIIFASIGGVGGVGTLGYWKYKGEINLCGKSRKWPCGSGKHNDDNSNSSVSQVKMDVMSTEKSDVDHKELSRNNSGNETSRETIPPRRTIHDENQGNGQSIRANGPNALPPITGYSKVRPDDNQFSGDPDKNTPNNEANYTPRPLTILPNIR